MNLALVLKSLESHPALYVVFRKVVKKGKVGRGGGKGKSRQKVLKSLEPHTALYVLFRKVVKKRKWCFKKGRF